jgi:hypothetical protein
MCVALIGRLVLGLLHLNNNKSLPRMLTWKCLTRVVVPVYVLCWHYVLHCLLVRRYCVGRSRKLGVSVMALGHVDRSKLLHIHIAPLHLHTSRSQSLHSAHTHVSHMYSTDEKTLLG